MKNELLRGSHIYVTEQNTNLLEDFNFDLYEGEILGVCGLSGSGKSVLCDLLTGRRALSGGTLYYRGREIRSAEIAGGRTLRVIDVNRNQPKLIPDLTIYENLTLLSAESWFPDLTRRIWTNRIRGVFSLLDLHFDLNRKAGDLSLAEQFFIEIARAVLNRCELLIFHLISYDFSTSDYTVFQRILHILSDHNISIINIEARADYLIGESDRILVIREGSDAFVFPKNEQKAENILKAMEVTVQTGAYRPVPVNRDPESVFSISDLMMGNILCDRLNVRRGEFVGIIHENGQVPAELMQFFRHEIEAETGSIFLNGQSLDIHLNIEKLTGLGMGFVDGYKENGLLTQSVAQNLLLSSYRFIPGPLINGREEKTLIAEALRNVGLTEADADRLLMEFGLFERQKIIFERWLLARPAILIMDYPFRRMDDRLLEWFRSYLARLRKSGTAVLCTMPDDPQYMALCDAVYVIAGSRLLPLQKVSVQKF